MMSYGRFSGDGREYLIENVATPTPWINYLYNGRYFATVSNHGGGISYVGNPLHGRITRYRINDVPPDRPGKYLYLRDRDSGGLWSLTWQPVGRDRERYRVAHGFGYTRASAEVEEVASTVVYFVPREDDCEIWRCTLANLSGKARRLSLFGYVEFCLGHAQVDLINQCDDQHFNRVFFDGQANALFATKTYWITEHAGTQQQENQAWDQWAYFTASEPVVRYETLRERFIGPFRNEGNPEALEHGELSSRDTDYGNAVGALRVDLTLEPGGRREVVFTLGVIPKDRFQVQRGHLPAKYRSLEAVDGAFEGVRKKWSDYFNYIKAVTPERSVDRFLNYWTPYQARVAFDVGRVASFYYWGISRGFGFRDTAQDTLAVSQSDPGLARERVLLLGRQMFSTGKVLHHFFGDGRGETTLHCDDPFWFILAVTDYVKETGDPGILYRQEPFLDGGTGTVLDRLMAVARLAGTGLGGHGLPAFGRGDWNDTLDYIGGEEGGESAWGGMFYAAMLGELAGLLGFVGKAELRQEVQGLKERLSASIVEHCWDGEWFLRAFGEKGRRIGSRESEAGRIFLNAQSWAVIAGVAERERLLECMDSVKAHLDTPFGPKICAPAYREIDPAIGLITRCAPGKKENGAVFCHTVTWAVMAECLLGRGNRAFEYYEKTLPDRIDQDLYSAEPFVYSQYITSDEHESPGRASHSWQTGTAAWMKRVVVDHLLGVRADYPGLVVDPVIPSRWKGFKVERVFRGCRYCIEVENPEGLERGAAAVRVDGKVIEGNLLPLCSGESCRVQVTLHAPAEHAPPARA